MYAPPPPRKVRQGQIDERALIVETMQGDRLELPWAQVRCVFAARLEPAPPQDAQPQGGLQGLRPQKGQSKARADATAASAAMGNTPCSIIDLYLDRDPSPLRFETTGTNMRSLLGAEAGYSGDINFALLLGRLAPHLPHAVHRSVAEVVAKGRHAVQVFTSREDLTLASREAFREMMAGRGMVRPDMAAAVAEAFRDDAPPAQGRPAQAPPAQELPAQAPPVQELPAQAPPVQELPAQAPPAQELPAQAPQWAELPPAFQKGAPAARAFPPPPPFPDAPPVQRPAPSPFPGPAPHRPAPLMPSPPPHGARRAPIPAQRDMFGEMRAAERQSTMVRAFLFAAVAAAIAWAMWALSQQSP